MSRDERMYDESVSHAPKAQDVIDFVKQNPGCEIWDIFERLGDTPEVRYAVLDLCDTGELDDERERYRFYYEANSSKRHGRWY